MVRGIAGSARRIGNFWVDFTRSLVRVFVPLSVLASLVLVSQGAVQNFSGFKLASTLAGGTQQIPGGPVASMEAIKLLGTNGGSMYGRAERTRSRTPPASRTSSTCYLSSPSRSRSSSCSAA